MSPTFLVLLFLPSSTDKAFVTGLSSKAKVFEPGFFETSKTGLSTGVWSTLASSAVTTGTWPWALTLTVFPLTSHQRFPCGPSFGRSTISPSMRFRVQYTRICGLWFGKTKADMNLFFTPCKSELERFHGVSPFVPFFLPSLPSSLWSCCLMLLKTDFLSFFLFFFSSNG